MTPVAGDPPRRPVDDRFREVPRSLPPVATIVLLDVALDARTEGGCLAAATSARLIADHVRVDSCAARGPVYLLGKQPAVGSGEVAPLLTVFAEELLEVAERVAGSRPGRRLAPPLLALLDEAPSICPIPPSPQRLADGRGRGTVVMYGMQSLARRGTRGGPTAPRP